MKARVHPRLLKSEPLRRCKLDECRAACCLHGAWVDLVEIADIRNHAGKIKPHMAAGMDDPRDWFDERQEPDQHAVSGQVGHTSILEAPDHYGGTACVFLRPDHKCTLQIAAMAAGLHPWRFKPFYCILHPLDLDAQGRITLDETEAILAETASCLRPASESTPLIETFAEELCYLLGEKGYRQLKSGDPA